MKPNNVISRMKIPSEEGIFHAIPVRLRLVF
jgi:hypothetical protein